MKKLIAILMLTLLSVFAFAGDGINDFKTALTFTPVPADRIHVLDVSTIGTAKGQEYMTFGVLDARNDEMYGEIVSLDTANVNVHGASSGQTGNYTISLESTQILLIDYLYVEDGFDTTDYLLVTNADSNGATLDTLNLITDGRKTDTYFFVPTQDSTLYLMWGDTTTVAKNVLLRVMAIDR